MTNKPNRKSSKTKQSRDKLPTNKSSKVTKPNNKPIVISLLLGIFVIVFIGLKFKQGHEQQQTIRDLDSASKELRVIYDKLVELNGDNVVKTDWSKECEEASVKYRRGQVSCGIDGRITLGSDIGFSQADTLIIRSLERSSFHKNQEPIGSISEDSSNLRFALSSMWQGTYCSISYYKNMLDDMWNYNISCRKQVPDFLPGYLVR